MIYTVTLNPSLDYIVSVENFRLGLTNRTRSELLLPGGKGINVSTILNSLGIESTALGFAAGFTGRELISRVAEIGVNAKFLFLEEGLTRINLKLKDIEGTEINGMGPEISEEALSLLLEQLNSLEKGDVLFLSGSIPSSMPSDIYRQIMAMLDGREILTVVDATKEPLLNVLPYHPFLIKPNHHELGEIFDVTIETRQDVVPYGKRLQEMGAQNVLISLAGKGAVLIAANGQVLEAPVPDGVLVNGVGAGDSMVAGFMAGWMRKKEYSHAFYLGLAAGSASAYSEHLATGKEIETLYDRIVRSVQDKERTASISLRQCDNLN